MHRNHRKGASGRMIVGGIGLLGLLIAMAVYMNLFKHEAQTSLQQKKQATQQIEQIQKQLNIPNEQHNAQIEEALDAASGAPARKPTPTPTPVRKTATTRPAAQP